MDQNLSTFLWFHQDMKGALDFYQSLFPSFKLKEYNNFGDFSLASFEISGQKFNSIEQNSAQMPKFNDAISISVQVDGQAEVDRIWDAIVAKGEEIACGWCRDQWGLTWQITPIQMQDWLGSKDPEIAQYAMQEMRKMKKIIIADLHK
jgi:predicted 3-demethylubiquinone-9 3-methyltransferase (glyoxalase superfamily)